MVVEYFVVVSYFVVVEYFVVVSVYNTSAQARECEAELLFVPTFVVVEYFVEVYVFVTVSVSVCTYVSCISSIRGTRRIEDEVSFRRTLVMYVGLYLVDVTMV